MPSLFTKIAKGEIPAYKLAEDADFLAFLDINPLAEGHTMVIPKKETDYIFDIGDHEYMALWKFAKKVALGIQKVIPCEKVGVAVIGLEVAHAHIHLVPINTIYDIDFKKPKLQLPAEKFQQIARDISNAIVL